MSRAQESSWRVALVTGASSGIGRSLALELARAGTLVVLVARREAALREVAAEIAAKGGRARVEVLDIADTAATVARLRALDAELGGFDLVVANAGVGADQDAGPAYAWETLRGAFHTNFCGGAATLTAVLPQMVARGRGQLCGISSLASYGALPGAAAYCAPKAGLSMLLECLRLDTLGTGVAVTAVHVGFVRTPMLARSRHPLPFLIEPDEAARHIVRKLRSGPARIDFPWPMHVLSRGLAALPRLVRDFVARRNRY